MNAWQKDKLFWSILLVTEIGDDLHAPTSFLGEGTFIFYDTGTFCFKSDAGYDLYEYQGKRPYILERNGLPIHTSSLEYGGRTIYSVLPYWSQPQYDYSQGYLVDTGTFCVVTYGSPQPYSTLNTSENMDVVQIIVGAIIQFVTKPAWIPVIGQATWGLSAILYLNNGHLRLKWSLQVSYVNSSPTVPMPQFFSSHLDSLILQTP
ncbi:MAG: hypothetical protein ACOYYF_11120 [Chloroflexota bacterium]|nr:hypothetical protein [Chloroflexota bacterium]MBI5702489.1 hypothetical protein [Chloroflexota bacterium]